MALERRAFVQNTSVLAASVVLSGVGVSAYGAAASDTKSIDLFALHTSEYLSGAFWARGAYIEPNLVAIDYLLRDHRTGETHRIDPALLEYLHDLSAELSLKEPFHVISGYRSAATNARLRRQSGAVARRSFHMFGRAIDIRVPNLSSTIVREAAISLHRGGVGYYPRSDFVHLDTGRFRHWS